MPGNKKKKANPQLTSQSDFRELAKLLGRRGGKKRSENLSAERRREIAQKAAIARWSKKKKT